MPVEYFNPTPIYFNDISVSEYETIKVEIYDSLKPEHFNEVTWGDLVKTTTATTFNIVELLKLQNLKTMITREMNIFMDLLKTNDIKLELHESWFNITNKYGFQDLHEHTSQFIKHHFSGVYYYEPFFGNNEHSLLEFETYNSIGKKVINYKYLPGRIILFHGSVPHRVTYNKSEFPRTSFSFNFKY